MAITAEAKPPPARVARLLGTALLLLASCATPPATPPETWADYSLMGTAATATLWADGAPASRYAWSAVAPDEAHIRWGVPQAWPPELRERFLVRGDWIMLDGWWDHGTYFKQEVTDNRWCDAQCNHCRSLPVPGPQHYTRREVAAQGYCLKARGTIVNGATGARINFTHDQVYSPPAPCDNAALKDQRCITQHETWWDDNGSAFGKKLERTILLAKGLGPGFVTAQTFPSDWRAEWRPPVAKP
jgi:hypothetical protein